MGVDIVERLKRAQVTRATYTTHGVDFEGFASPVVGERDRNAELDFVLGVFRDAADEIERLREYRDHARREICERIAALAPSMSAAQIARERGWDCYPRKQPRKPKGATNGG